VSAILAVRPCPTHRGLAPEEQQLLRRGHLIQVDERRLLAWLRPLHAGVHDARLEQHERHRRDDVPRGLARPEAPGIISVEPAAISAQFTSRVASYRAPHTQHIDQMLLGHVVLLVHVPLQRSENARALLERPATLPLELA